MWPAAQGNARADAAGATGIPPPLFRHRMPYPAFFLPYSSSRRPSILLPQSLGGRVEEGNT
ncbi:hypothetical protein AXF42_Ash015960 [Apostasia shenzhenica]|uniref:Uncharacterized protein n=1 Tax=Apostasia shenzhenica TaxID=1088818 RepID=A0A2I0AWH8_9ASPA|nr:hypothetical protein AXF42_Ash015960 [Apostasia shenzhenica]